MRLLAQHEGLLQYFELNEESLRRSCFDEPRRMELLVAEDEGAIVGFASYLTQFSPWAARDYLYLDDLYVSEAARGRGAGSLLMRHLGTIALERGIDVRWHVELASHAQQFYRSLGAVLRDRFSAYWSLDAIRAEIERS
jgi:GNAT superfamily N-acetyltransferase